ncbi:MAG: hypothetical protein ACERKD_23785 [Prolixibacteraceae bacterium]
MSYINKHKEGVVLTILVHLAVLLILLQFGFFTPLPLPEDKGVLIDFGNSATGMGKIEPTVQATPVQVQQEIPQEVVTPPPTPPKVEPSIPEVKSNSGKEEVVTQDFEKTVALEAGKKKKEEEDKKKRDEEALKKKALDEQKRKEEVAKQQQIVKDRNAREAKEKRRADSLQQIENIRIAEVRIKAEKRRQDSIAQAAEQAKIDAINKRAENVFGGSSTGQTNNSSTSSGQGATYGGGNQGTATGTPGANTYGLGGGKGITFNLSGRSAETLPKPSYPGQEEGVVVVQVTVDKSGIVTKAEPGVKGTTSLDAGLLNSAKQAALSTRFNEDKNAPAFQTGTITYRFVLN